MEWVTIHFFPCHSILKYLNSIIKLQDAVRHIPKSMVWSQDITPTWSQDITTYCVLYLFPCLLQPLHRHRINGCRDLEHCCKVVKPQAHHGHLDHLWYGCRPLPYMVIAKDLLSNPSCHYIKPVYAVADIGRQLALILLCPFLLEELTEVGRFAVLTLNNAHHPVCTSPHGTPHPHLCTWCWSCQLAY